MKKRCDWLTDDKIYLEYHDKEWGVPVFDDRALFEMLILEGAQAKRNGHVIILHTLRSDIMFTSELISLSLGAIS